MSNNADSAAPSTRRPRLLRRVQTVYLIRHAIATHNIPDPRTGRYPDPRDPAYEDPPLVPAHTAMASEAGRRTASLAFPPAAGGIAAAPRILCDERVREAYGAHYPDKRGKLSDAKREFPWVHFPPTMSETDEDWMPDRRETTTDVMGRVVDFVEGTLARRAEECVVVVGHGVWIEVCLLHYFPEVLDMGRKRVYNCDAYRLEVISEWEEGSGESKGGGMTRPSLVRVVDAQLVGGDGGDKN